MNLILILSSSHSFPSSLPPFLLYARIWSQEKRMMSIRNWSGKQKALHHLRELLYVELYVCAYMCVCPVTHLPLTFFSHSPITLAWTSLWHSGIISRHALTGSAPSPVCCCCVGCLCLCLRKNKRDWGTGDFGASLSLCSLFRYEQCQSWSPTHISSSSSCHIHSVPSCSRRTL